MVRCLAEVEFGEPTDRKHMVIERTTFSAGSLRAAINNYKGLNGKQLSKSTVYCLGHDYFFQLDRQSNDRPYSVVSLSKLGALGEEDKQFHYLYIDNILTSTFSISLTPVTAIVEHPSFRVVDATVVRREGDNRQGQVNIKFTCEDKRHWIRGGLMSFAPDLDWALTAFDVAVDTKRPGFTFGSPRGARFRGEFHPRRWPPGLVFAENGWWKFVYDDGSRYKDPIKQFKVTSLDFAKVPDSQFKPSAFGVTDAIVEPARTRYLAANHYLLIVAVACLLMSILLKRIASR
jgi:hypothetical protein